MSKFEYRGESTGKIWGRAIAYGRIDCEPLYNDYHIVVAGLCGDIDYLLNVGVDPGHIIACDKKPEYLEAARARGVIIPPDEIGYDLVRTTAWAVQGGKQLASHNTDLCTSLIQSVPILRQCLDLIEKSPRWTLCRCAFTFLCAHDPGLGKDENEENPGQKRIDYFNKIVRRPLVRYEAYQSWTKTSRGSPMCVVFL
jgi:hypothetical protein